MVGRLLTELADTIERCRELSEPRTFADNPFRLACRVEGPAAPDEIEAAWADAALPAAVPELWRRARSAELFVDVDYGQWGLRLLAPAASAQRTREQQQTRPDDAEQGDVVLGEFLGDLELVIVTSSGAVLIALPLDPRSDWDRPAGDVAGFLAAFVDAHGAKFWEGGGGA